MRLEPNREYLLEVVIRILDVGISLTQGTADSNQFRLDVHMKANGRTVGRSGEIDDRGVVEFRAGGRTQRRSVVPNRSCLSQVWTVVTFGLGREASIESLRVRWPDGTEQEVSVEGVNRRIVIPQESS